ncbi:hypothetical protein RCOM_0507750 [Ricinus communis]|uniref:Uncharacterized protein n=1 Tax=Ricinus communis TaxID=3988 RepID=B9T0E1_RICCO|nr:hypothetical protein RCOM_0507750 [Ricinus communis]
MANPAARMMLFRNGKSFPLHLLPRGPVSGASGAIDIKTKLNNIADPRLFQFHPNLNVDKNSNIGAAFAHGNLKFGGFGVVGKSEARGKKIAVPSDEDDDDDDHDDEEDHDGDFEDEDIDLEDSDDYDDDDDDDEDDEDEELKRH